MQPLRDRDGVKEMNFLAENWRNIDSANGAVCIFYERGPFTRTSDYLRASLDDVDHQSDEEDVLGKQRMMRTIIKAIGTLEDDRHGLGATKVQNFTLGHADLDSQNILVNEDGSPAGILDWDSIHTGPKQLGYAAYPRFLTRDILPGIYTYWPDEMQSPSTEDPPSVLRDFEEVSIRLQIDC